MPHLFRSLAVALTLAALPAQASEPVQLAQAKQQNGPAAETCSPNQGGKYADLLHQMDVPVDRQQYGPCHDFGWWDGEAYAGYTNLTPGFWVYAYPRWYIWRTRR